MGEEEKNIIRDGWHIHRNNLVRILAYRPNLPGNLRAHTKAGAQTLRYGGTSGTTFNGSYKS